MLVSPVLPIDGLVAVPPGNSKTPAKVESAPDFVSFKTLMIHIFGEQDCLQEYLPPKISMEEFWVVTTLNPC